MASQIKLKVEPTVLRNTASEVTRLTGTLSAAFDEMQRLVARTDRYWVGEAGNYYRREFAEQKKETEDILRILKKYPKDLLEMAGIYETAEKENTQAVAALPSDFL